MLEERKDICVKFNFVCWYFVDSLVSILRIISKVRGKSRGNSIVIYFYIFVCIIGKKNRKKRYRGFFINKEKILVILEFFYYWNVA